MATNNCNRAGCEDVFKSYLVREANYDGYLDIPVVKREDAVPNRLIPFSKAISAKDHNQWVHFYEDDVKFERIWRNPQKYLPILKKFKGVITPDFSLYRDMPLAMQYWNLYRSRALGHWLQSNGVKVIVNVRFGDHRTYEASCFGVPASSTIAIGSHGNLRPKEDYDIFTEGVYFIVKKLHPRRLIVYGAAPESIFAAIENMGIEVISFPSEFAKTHSKEGV